MIDLDLARLEANVGHIKTDIGDVKSDIRSLNVLTTEVRANVVALRERMVHLPTKDFIVKTVLVMPVLVMLAIVAVLAVFQAVM